MRLCTKYTRTYIGITTYYNNHRMPDRTATISKLLQFCFACIGDDSDVGLPPRHLLLRLHPPAPPSSSQLVGAARPLLYHLRLLSVNYDVYSVHQPACVTTTPLDTVPLDLRSGSLDSFRFSSSGYFFLFHF